MDQRLIEEKLEALRQCVARVEAKRPATAKILTADPDLQDILALNLTRAVQICVDIAAHIIADSNIPAPETMAQAFDALGELKIIEPELAVRMKKAVGFRNTAVHSYQAIDWEIVFNICRQNLDDFKRFARAVANTLR